MTDTIIIAVISALTSGGCLAFIQFLISRHDKKKERAEDMDYNSIQSALLKLEKDGLRTQLLLMLLLKPKEESEILTIAERYFKKPPEGLGGNWYMTTMFKSWLKEYAVGQPEWFETE